MPLRWYAISLLAPPLILLLTATALYGRATLRALGQNWLLTLTSFLPALVVMIVFKQRRRRDWLDGLHVRAAPRSSRSTSCGAIDHGVRLAVSRAQLLCRNKVLGSHGHHSWLPPAAASSQPIHCRLALQRLRLKRVHSRTLSCDAQRNGESDWLGYRRLRDTQTDILVIISGLAIVAGGIIAVATRGRLGLGRPSGSGAHRSVG